MVVGAWGERSSRAVVEVACTAVVREMRTEAHEPLVWPLRERWGGTMRFASGLEQQCTERTASFW
jgi:hypothetical protein